MAPMKAPEFLAAPLPASDKAPFKTAAQGDAGLPLSFAQQRLWFLEQLEPNTARYNVPLAARLNGALRPELLEHALNEVLARHEALRTNFGSASGTPFQVIREGRRVEIDRVDLSQGPAEKREADLRRLLRAEAQRPFDLERDLLIRASLFQVNPDEHVLLLTLHHIVCDEWSLRVLFRELTMLYEAERAGRTCALPDLPIQYADFAMWQREMLQGRWLEKELNFWKEALENAPPRLQLPVDRVQTDGRGHLGFRESRDLPMALSRKVAELSRKEGVTLFILLLAAFKALLWRHTGQEDLVVGSPIAGRTRVETEELIGFFVNTLVFRTRIAGDLTFQELLRRVRETVLGAYEHQEVPFEILVEALHPDRRPETVPLVQAAFGFEHGTEDAFRLPGLEVEFIDVDTQTSKFDLTWIVRETSAGLRVCVEYAAGLFEQATVVRLLDRFETLLEGIVEDPSRPLAVLPLLRPEERNRILVEWNQTDRSYPATASVPELFDEQVRRAPDAVAVRFGSVQMSYAELSRRAERVTAALRAAGVKPGAKVGLCLERSAVIVAAMLGILKAGAVYVPMDPAYPRERLAWMLADAEALVVLTETRFREALPADRARILCIDDAFEPGAESGFRPGPKPDDIAYVIYTSGSTGKPKGVAVSHRAIVRLVCNTDYVQLTPDDRVAQASNACFDAATFEIWGALLNGATLIGIERETILSPKELAARIAGDRITTLFLTTALFNQVAAEEPGAFRPLKHLLFGGELVDPRSVRRILERQPPERLLHVYGPTETTTFATWHVVREAPIGPGTIPIGRPIANTRLYVLDAALEPVPPGVPGEICIGGPGVARGYQNRPEATAEKFVPDPFSPVPGARLYRTGDLGRFRPDGSVEFIGRSDQQLKIRGFRIEPGEVEAMLAAHPAVRECAVTAVEDGGARGKRLVAFIVPQTTKETGRAMGLREFLKSKLPSYMVPSAIVPVAKLPLNSNGKVDRSVLAALEQGPAGEDEAFVAPRTPAEVRLAAIWSDILGVQRVGIRDSFFDLGGHSLLAVRLFAAIEREFGKKLPLASLFKSPTIEALGELIGTRTDSPHWPLMVALQPEGSTPPFFWVHSLGGDGGGAFFYYRKLAGLLGADQPSYGIRSPQEPFTDLNEMAGHYVDQLLRFQPQGPYFLGGFCFGGIVAYEMAVQLRRRGCEVGLLALLESAPPTRNRGRPRLNLQSAMALARNVRAWIQEAVHQDSAQFRSRLQRKAKALRQRMTRWLSRADQSPPSTSLKDLINVETYPKDYVRYAEAHWKALLSYKPVRYPGSIVLFRARKQALLCVDPTLGWGDLAEKGVAVNVIPGTHEQMLEEPNVHILAAELKRRLIEAQAGQRDPDAMATASQTRSGAPSASTGTCSFTS
ncbi:MAG: amino acid adenylation domain-containing protein [Verrucomicrobiia bacterium]